MTAGPGAPSAPNYGWRIGRLGGVPVYIGRSYPVFALAVVVFYGSRITDASGESGGRLRVCRGRRLRPHPPRLGPRPRGCARRRRDAGGAPRRPDGRRPHGRSHRLPGRRAPARIERRDHASSGRRSNLVLAAVGYGAQGVFPDGVAGLLLYALTMSNLLVGVLNLLPGLPLDGGFVVEAIVWKATGSRHRGLVVAGWAGRVLTVALIAWVIGRPLLNREQPSLFLTRLGRPHRGVPLGRGLQRHQGRHERAGDGAGAAPARAAARGRGGVARASVRGAAPGRALSRARRRRDRTGRPVGLVDIAAARAVTAEALAAGVALTSVVARQPEGGWSPRSPGPTSPGSSTPSSSRSGPGDAAPPARARPPAGVRSASVSLADLDAALQA